MNYFKLQVDLFPEDLVNCDLKFYDITQKQFTFLVNGWRFLSSLCVGVKVNKVLRFVLSLNNNRTDSKIII